MKKYIILFLLLVPFALLRCRKDHVCFDQQLYDQHKNDACTTDCPGVLGCDGKTYCNECEANRLGVRVQH